MALGGKKKSKGSNGAKKPAEYVRLFDILRSQDDADKLYAKASTYKGRLIWQKFGGDDGDDESDSQYFEVKSAFIGEPHEKSPEFVVNQIVVNLKNPKAAEEIE